jgi:hypothetical protein
VISINVSGNKCFAEASERTFIYRMWIKVYENHVCQYVRKLQPFIALTNTIRLKLNPVEITATTNDNMRNSSAVSATNDELQN